jgi:hypothetical protein
MESSRTRQATAKQPAAESASVVTAADNEAQPLQPLTENPIKTRKRSRNTTDDDVNSTAKADTPSCPPQKKSYHFKSLPYIANYTTGHAS